MNDADQYNTVVNSMEIVGFGSGEQRDVQAIVAAILHLGNIRFQDQDGTSCTVDNGEVAQRVSKVGRGPERWGGVVGVNGACFPFCDDWRSQFAWDDHRT